MFARFDRLEVVLAQQLAPQGQGVTVVVLRLVEARLVLVENREIAQALGDLGVLLAKLLDADAERFAVVALRHVVLAARVIVAAHFVQETGVLDALGPFGGPHHGVGFAVEALGLGEVSERSVRAGEQNQRFGMSLVGGAQGSRLRQRRGQDQLRFAGPALLQGARGVADRRVHAGALRRRNADTRQRRAHRPRGDTSPRSRSNFRKRPHRETVEPCCRQFTADGPQPLVQMRRIAATSVRQRACLLVGAAHVAHLRVIRTQTHAERRE
ncbi:MAG: hypothetical protein R2724_13870 [Bryobacterales bacterium]